MIKINYLDFRNDPEKLVERLDKLSVSKAPSKATSTSSKSEAAPSSKVKEESKGNYMQSQTKKLNDVMKIELLAALPAAEIGAVRIYEDPV